LEYSPTIAKDGTFDHYFGDMVDNVDLCKPISKTRKGKPITRQHYVPIDAIAATYSEHVADNAVIISPEEEAAATYKDTYLLISNRVDNPEVAAYAYAKRWRIEVFYRMAKQIFRLNSCTARSQTAHFAHIELLFTAITLNFLRLVEGK